MDTTPRLGIMDWGIGGMGVLRSLRRRRKSLPILYVSDSGYTPYGLLPRKALAHRVSAVVGWMAANGATSIVVACNAASTILDLLAARAALSVPVSGVIVPALALVPSSFRGTVGVLGGARTIRSGVYRRGLASEGRRIVQRIAQPLSAHIEAGRGGSDECAADLHRIMGPVRKADMLILACTHYPAIAAAIGALAPDARLIDPADGVVEHVLRYFPLPPNGAPDRIVATGDCARMREAAKRAWGMDPGGITKLCLPGGGSPQESLDSAE